MSTINKPSLLRIYTSPKSWDSWELHIFNKNLDILFSVTGEFDQHIDEYILNNPRQAAIIFDKIYKNGIIDINEDDLDRLINASKTNSNVIVLFQG